MEPNRKRPSVKKDGNRSDVSQPKFPPSQSFARPPTTGTSSSSSSEDRSMLVKSSDDTSPEDQIEMVPAANERGIEISFPSHTPKFGEISSAVRSGLELKFNSGPSAYFSSNKSDLPVDINLSPQDGNRIPSPSSISSLTSRPLEWDSGADVGYMEPGIETGLSTIERIALAQGSAILLPRSDPEGTTETGSKPVTKLVIPAVERLIGTPAAESTLIKDKFLSPVVGLKSFLPEGISPIISSNAYLAANSKETRKEHHNNEARTSLELQFKHLSLAENNAGRNQEGLSHDTANRESNELSQDSQTPVNVETENLEDDGSDTHNIESNDIPVIKFGHKEESKSSEDLLKALPEEESVFPLSLKKSASCSNLQQVSQSVNQHFLKPLKRHFQNSASSSSISTVIDRSKKKSRKLFLTSSSISERTETRSKASKFPRKILSPSKKFHFSNNSNKASQSCLPPKSHRKLAENPLDLISTSKNSQVAFHTSIQQSILDELQQCVNEISNNFNSSSRSKHSGDKIVGAQEEGKKGSGSTRENCSTLESIASVQTNDSWAMDLNAKDSLTSAEKAKSFEYLPGDIYERNSSEHFQLQKKSESSCSTSEKIDFSVSSKEESWNPSSLHLFERELERGVNLLKDFINNSTSFDSRKKLLLVKKIAKKLIELENESYLKSASKGGPSGYRKPTAKASDTYLRDQFSKQQRAKGSSSELSDSTRISQSYIDTTSGSSCLNLVMKPLKKSTSVESISEQPQKISSGIRHIQENYRSNNCTFNSDGEEVNDETYVDERIVRQNPEKTNKASENQGGAKMSDNYGFESSSMGWSKSSCSTDNQQSAFYGMEFRQSTNKLPSKKHHMLSPHHQRHAKYRDIGRNKVNGSRLIENSNDLIDGRTINLGGSRFKPFLISDNDSSSKGYFDHNAFPWPDWRKPTSDSERRYEEKLVVQKGDKKESTLLYKYLDAERRNHLLWIQSEINHLSNLKALIEKQAKFKENFKLLKSKRVDCKGDFREKHSKNTQKSSSDSTKVSDDANSNGPISFQPKSANASTNSSDKENRDITNKNVIGGKVVESLVRSKFGVSTSKNQSQNQTFKSQLSSNESRYISADSDATNNTWAEDSIKVPDKSLKKSKTVSSKPKKNSSLHKKVMKPVSYTILFDPPKIAPNFLTRNASPKIIKDVESSANSKVSELSLQECLAKKHPEIIRRAEFRRNCIAELSCLRQLQNERKKQIVTAVISSEEVPKPSVSLPSLKEKRIFTQKKLRQQTEKKYRQSFEVKQKLKEQKTKEDYRTNRLMAEVFARKLQRKTLRGQVDLSNSVMVLES